MSNDNVIDFNSRKNMNDKTAPEFKPGKFEFHFFPIEDSSDGEVATATGFLKFGPQFIAVTEAHDDNSPVVFACATNTLKYVKRLDEDDSIQSTLAL